MITIKRTYTPTHTHGELYLDGCLFCYTLELPWINNETDISCIPEGVYQCKWRGKRIDVLDVPDRIGIQIHIGNSVMDTTGCILPGMLWIAPEVRDSKIAMQRLRRETSDEFELEIYDVAR